MAFELSSWGRLWDQTDSVAAHTQKGIDFFEKYGNFVKERALIEEEYAAKLRGLAKKNFGKRKDEDLKSFTYISTFYTVLKELESLAGQHEVVAETLKKNISPQILTKCAELRQTRKNQLAHLQKLNADLSKAIEVMEKTHRSYAKAFKEAEAAHLKHEQNDKDLNLSRAAVEKSKNNVIYKNQLCEEAKKNYANALLIANDAKVKHYEVELPNLLEQMKAADRDRISNTRLAMQKTIEAETNVIRIIQVCYDEMLKAVSNIDADADTQMVLEQNVSGYPVPENYHFDDLGDPGALLTHHDNTDNSSMKRGTLPLLTKNGSTKTSSIGRRQSMHQKFFGGGASEKPKINGVQSDYGNLPPQQRCRKIQAKLDELLREQDTLNKSLDGVEKMAEVYKGNPKLGNPKDVEPKIVEYKGKISRVNSDIAKYKNLIENIQNEMKQSGSDNIGLRSPYNGHSSPSSNASPRISSSGYGSANNTNRTSYSEESVSSEGSHGLSSRKITPIPVPVINGNIAKQPIINLQKEPSPIRPSPPAQSHETRSDTYEEFDLPVLGVCTARYSFEGSSDGTTVAMKEGEEMWLLEKDAGDGWTRIRMKSAAIEGFVPSSYLDMTWY
jgi:hypothetical protein